MTRPILIRCDASLSIGSGHVMRCFTLARELRRRGASITFLCRRQSGDLIGLLEQEFPVLVLPKLPTEETQRLQGEPLQGRELYGAWLGCSQRQDAADCLQALAEVGIRTANWLVVDHYGLDITWEGQLLAGLGGDATPRLLVIDDLADRSHQADLLLDQNFFGVATEARYMGLVPARCRQLLGPHYALLGPEYAQLHPITPPRTELRRILVFFGGIDQANLTGRALEALQAPELALLAVDVVLGLQSPHRQAVAEMVAHRPYTTLHNPLPSLAGLIARSDLAIGAVGTTTWERTCLGLPSMVVTIADNQQPIAQALDQAGEIILLGSTSAVGAKQIRQAVVAALHDAWPRASGKALSDGWGAARVASALQGPQHPLKLKKATECDEELLLRWANDPQVRTQSFSPDPIDKADHKQWFQAVLADPNRLLLIARDSQDCPLGQIRFDRQAPTSIEGPREALIGLSLDRCARGQGLAKELVRLGLEAMGQHFGQNTEAVAEVLAGNDASQATFSRTGFQMDPLGVTSPSVEARSRWRWRPSVSNCSMPPHS